MPTIALELSCTSTQLSVSAILTQYNRYLVEGLEGAVLHTGDFRAEPSFLESVVKEPLLQMYLASSTSCSFTRLEAIHLDTACLLNETELPSKVYKFPLSLELSN